MSLAELAIVVTASTTGAIDALKRVNRQVEETRNRFQNLSKTLGNVGDTFMSVGAKLGAAVAPATLAMGHAVKTGMDFEKQMKMVQAVLGATGKEFEQLTEFAKHLGETTVFSASQAAEAMLYMAQAGMTMNEIFNTTKATLDLAAATQTDLAFASGLVVSVLRGFGISTEEAARVTNTLAAAMTMSRLSMEDYAYSFPYISSVARSLGLQFEEVVAVLGKLRDNGIRAESAGRLLATSLGRLKSPPEKVVDAIEKLGLSLEDLDPAKHTIAEMVEALDRAGAKTEDYYAIFGAEGARIWLALRGQADAIRELQTKITETSKASEMAKIQLDSFSGVITILKSQLEGIEITIFDTLKEDLEAVLTRIQEFMPTLKVMAAAFATGVGRGIRTFLDLGNKILSFFERYDNVSKQSIIQTLGFGTVMAAATSPMLIGLGVLLRFSSGLMSFVGTLTSLHPALLLVAIAMGGLIYAWKQGWIDLSGITNTVIPALVNAFNWLRDVITSLWQGITRFFENFAAAIAANKDAGKFFDMIGAGLSVIGEALANLAAWLKPAFGELSIWLGVFGKVLGTLVGNAFAWLAEKIPPVVEGIKQFIDALAN